MSTIHEAAKCLKFINAVLEEANGPEPVSTVQPSLDERFMTPAELAQHYAQGLPDHAWGAHPDFIRNDWKLEVMHDNTQRGYWEWVALCIEEAWEDGVHD